jgi:hypothetical protein
MNNKFSLLGVIGSVLAALGLICGLTTISVASEYVSNFERVPAIRGRPPQVATWKRTPTVIVCNHAPISEQQIDSAVKIWGDLGYKFFTTQYRYDPLDKCKEKSPVGYILIHLVRQNTKMEEDDLAQTHFFVDNDHNEIEWAVIYMKPDTRETVLEHEIGHALGFLHFNKLNHLMNEKWTQGGWETSGLENRR